MHVQDAKSGSHCKEKNRKHAEESLYALFIVPALN